MTENSKCFIDSNLWLYNFIESQDAAKSQQARELISRVKSQLCMSSQVVNEVCVNLLKKADFDEIRIKQLIIRFYFDYEIVAIDQSILLMASEIRTLHPFLFWDSVLVAAALEAKAQVLYSEDMRDGFVVDGRLKIVNPFRN